MALLTFVTTCQCYFRERGRLDLVDLYGDSKLLWIFYNILFQESRSITQINLDTPPDSPNDKSFSPKVQPSLSCLLVNMLTPPDSPTKMSEADCLPFITLLDNINEKVDNILLVCIHMHYIYDDMTIIFNYFIIAGPKRRKPFKISISTEVHFFEQSENSKIF